MRKHLTFDEVATTSLPQLSPAEIQVVQYFRENREEVMVASAAILASRIGTSDATVIRAVKALGYSGLDALRQDLAAELRRNLSPASRLARTLGEMGPHTANAGMVYFASGTPDRSDIFGERVDLGASVRRELLEETGISPDKVAMAAGWTIVYAPPRIACLKITHSPDTALDIKTRVEAFLADDPNPELCRMHIVRRQQEIGAIRCPRFIVDFLNHALKSA